MTQIRSMTGFARTRREFSGLELALTLKSVNHRSLDIHFHMSPDLDEFEPAMRGAIKRELGRGHVNVRVSLGSGGAAAGAGVDSARLAAYVAAFRLAAEEHHLEPRVDLNSAFRIPGMLTDTASVPIPEGFGPVLLETLDHALAELNAFRAREGAEIAALLRGRAQSIAGIAGKIEKIRERALPAFHIRLRERLAELLENSQVDPQRLAQEAAILADRSDVAEETERLRIHARQTVELLSARGEIGKKLDFLLQEMNRETNTILSKTAGIGETGLEITELALAAKSDIEKIREQALNLE